MENRLLPLAIAYDFLTISIFDPHERIVGVVLILRHTDGVITVLISLRVTDRLDILWVLIKHLLGSQRALLSRELLDLSIRLTTFLRERRSIHLVANARRLTSSGRPREKLTFITSL